jgi:hypothetical protein
VASAARYYRLRIRSADDTTDALIISSVPGGANPYLASPPRVDGQSVDPKTGRNVTGACTVRVVDAITSGTDRVVTSQLCDADGRIYLIGRRAYAEWSNDGATWAGGTNGGQLFAGYVLGHPLVGALVYEFHLGDTRRVEQGDVFRSVTANFDQVSCVIGGPVRGGWGGTLYDAGGVRVRVGAVTTGAAGRVRLDYRHRFPLAAVRRLHARTRGYFVRDARTWAAASVLGSFPRLTVRVENPDQTLVGQFTPLALAGAELSENTPFIATQRAFDYLVDSLGASTYLSWATTGPLSTGLPAQPSVGTEYVVYVYPLDISPANPLHIYAHPVDILTDLWDDAGLAWDATSASDAKDAIGPGRRMRLRIERPLKLSDFAANALLGPNGLGTRVDTTTGELQVFRARVKVDTTPSVTVTDDDLTQTADGTPESGRVFDVDESTAINSVVVRELRPTAWSADDGTPEPLDGVTMVPEEWRENLKDAAGAELWETVGLREVVYEIPGELDSALSLAKNIANHAGGIFDRYGPGAIEGEFIVTENSTAAASAIGDEVILDISHLPNNNARGGARIVQLVQKSQTPGRVRFNYVDSGTSTQPGTDPTFTIAANATAPKREVDLEITNYAALAAAGYSVEIEWARGDASPSGAGEPLAVLSPDDLTENVGVVSTPTVDSGAIVAARMRSVEKGLRPSVWTAWDSVDLTDLTAPSASALSGTPTDPARPTFTWTAGETDVPVEVLFRLDGESSSAAVVYQVLPPGSTQYTPQLASATDAVIFGFRYRDFPPYAGVSTTEEITYTPGVAAITLAAPTNPSAFSGRTDDTGVAIVDGTYGLDVDAAEVPGFVEFAVAPETAAGSATAGSYETVAVMPAVQGGRTRWTGLAANDGLKRFIKARSARAGATSSSYTAEVSVDPWNPAPPVLRGTVTTTATAVGAATPRIDVTVASTTRGIIRLYRNAGSAASALSAQLVATSDAGSASLAHSSTGLVAATVYHYLAVVTDVVTGATSEITSAARASATFPSAGSAASVTDVSLSGTAITQGSGFTSGTLTVTSDYNGATAGDLFKVDTSKDGSTWTAHYSGAATTGTVSGEVHSFSMNKSTWGDLFARVRITDSTGATTKASLTTSETSYYRS